MPPESIRRTGQLNNLPQSQNQTSIPVTNILNQGQAQQLQQLTAPSLQEVQALNNSVLMNRLGNVAASILDQSQNQISEGSTVQGQINGVENNQINNVISITQQQNADPLADILFRNPNQEELKRSRQNTSLRQPNRVQQSDSYYNYQQNHQSSSSSSDDEDEVPQNQNQVSTDPTLAYYQHLVQNLSACTICICQYDGQDKKPRLLTNCGHACCNQCLMSMHKIQVEKRISQEENRGIDRSRIRDESFTNQIECHVCKVITQSDPSKLPIVYQMIPPMNSIEKSTQIDSKQIKCQNCDKNKGATVFCQNCEVFICNLCKIAHNEKDWQNNDEDNFGKKSKKKQPKHQYFNLNKRVQQINDKINLNFNRFNDRIQQISNQQNQLSIVKDQVHGMKNQMQEYVKLIKIKLQEHIDNLYQKFLISYNDTIDQNHQDLIQQMFQLTGDIRIQNQLKEQYEAKIDKVIKESTKDIVKNEEQFREYLSINNLQMQQENSNLSQYQEGDIQEAFQQFDEQMRQSNSHLGFQKLKSLIRETIQFQDFSQVPAILAILKEKSAQRLILQAQNDSRQSNQIQPKRRDQKLERKTKKQQEMIEKQQSLEEVKNDAQTSQIESKQTGGKKEKVCKQKNKSLQQAQDLEKEILGKRNQRTRTVKNDSDEDMLFSNNNSSKNQNEKTVKDSSLLSKNSRNQHDPLNSKNKAQNKSDGKTKKQKHMLDSKEEVKEGDQFMNEEDAFQFNDDLSTNQGTMIQPDMQRILEIVNNDQYHRLNPPMDRTPGRFTIRQSQQIGDSSVTNSEAKPRNLNQRMVNLEPSSAYQDKKNPQSSSALVLPQLNQGLGFVVDNNSQMSINPTSIQQQIQMIQPNQLELSRQRLQAQQQQQQQCLTLSTPRKSSRISVRNQSAQSIERNLEQINHQHTISQQQAQQNFNQQVRSNSKNSRTRIQEEEVKQTQSITDFDVSQLTTMHTRSAQKKQETERSLSESNNSRSLNQFRQPTFTQNENNQIRTSVQNGNQHSQSSQIQGDLRNVMRLRRLDDSQNTQNELRQNIPTQGNRIANEANAHVNPLEEQLQIPNSLSEPKVPFAQFILSDEQLKQVLAFNPQALHNLAQSRQTSRTRSRNQEEIKSQNSQSDQVNRGEGVWSVLNWNVTDLSHQSRNGLIIPTNAVCATLGQHKNYILATGGTLNDRVMLLKFDNSTKSIEIKELDNRMNRKRKGHCLIYHEGYFYAIGGVLHKSIERLNANFKNPRAIETAEWELMKYSTQARRENFGAVSLDDQLILLIGSSSKEANRMSMETIRVNNHSSAIVQNVALPRDYSQTKAFIVQNLELNKSIIYVVGTCIDLLSTTTQVTRYVYEKLKLSYDESFPTKKTAQSRQLLNNVFIMDNHLYILGGKTSINDNGGEYLDLRNNTNQFKPIPPFNDFTSQTLSFNIGSIFYQ
eukprot:403368048